MCVFALLDVILPYAISLLLLVLSVGVLMSSRYFMQMRYRSLVIVCITVFVGGGLLWASINMKQTKVSQTIATEQVNIHDNVRLRERSHKALAVILTKQHYRDALFTKRGKHS